jgi:hypothetical protein
MSQATQSRTSNLRDLRNYGEPQSVRFLPAMPIRIEYRPLGVGVSCKPVKDDDFLFELEFADGKPCDSRHFIPYFTRTHFLDVRNSVEGGEFLSATGPFFAGTKSFPERYKALRWTTFRLAQDLVRIRMLVGPIEPTSVITGGFLGNKKMVLADRFKALFPLMIRRESDWLKCYPSGIVIGRDSTEQILRARIEVHSTFEAILASIYLDELIETRFLKCKLDECQRLVPRTSGRGGKPKEYCCHKHAHTANVRRIRAREKAAREKSMANGPKTSPTTATKGR